VLHTFRFNIRFLSAFIAWLNMNSTISLRNLHQTGTSQHRLNVNELCTKAPLRIKLILNIQTLNFVYQY